MERILSRRWVKHNAGFFISSIFHILILAIPVSFVVVQKFDEIELFVMTEEASSLQKQQVERKEIKKIEEKPHVQEEKIIEPVAISDKKEDIALPLETVNPPENVVREVTAAPALQSFSSDSASVPHDMEFGTATGPKFLHKELPVYPLMARKLGKEGRVVLRLTIDEKGNLLNIEVIEKSGYGFTEAAVEAVKRSTFIPAKKDGKSIASRALLPIRFTLRRD